MGKNRSPFLGAGSSCAASNLRGHCVVAPGHGPRQDLCPRRIKEDGRRPTALHPEADRPPGDDRARIAARFLPRGARRARRYPGDCSRGFRGPASDGPPRQNPPSVYTAAEIFPMLPEKLSTDLTSLGYREDRPAIVIEMVFGEEGSLRSSDLYGATVRNRAKLAYNSVAAWLEGEGPDPGPIAVVEGLAENLRIQDRVAQQLRAFRHEHGALDLETIEGRPVFDGDVIRDLEAKRRNRAKELIEDFMIAANGVTARYLKARKYPSLRRVVRSPKRWERIVGVASG